MAKLTKAQARAHEQAQQLLDSADHLNETAIQYVLTHWQESATHVNSTAGAYFTPTDLASDFTLEVGEPSSVVDLCAGIGTLSLALWHRHLRMRQMHLKDDGRLQMVCVEVNPDYVQVGARLLPQAHWITGSIFDPGVQRELAAMGPFEVAVSNPPFGRITPSAPGAVAGYTGAEFDLQTVAYASTIAKSGVFILPSASLGWEYSGRPRYLERTTTKYERFARETGIQLTAGCGIDTSAYTGWHGVRPVVEIALAGFDVMANCERSSQPA